MCRLTTPDEISIDIRSKKLICEPPISSVNLEAQEAKKDIELGISTGAKTTERRPCNGTNTQCSKSGYYWKRKLASRIYP